MPMPVISSFCHSGGCVGVVDLPNGVGVRVLNTTDPGGPTVTFTADEWAAFVAGVKAGEFDLPALQVASAGSTCGPAAG